MPAEKYASKDNSNGRQSLSPAMRGRLEKLIKQPFFCKKEISF